MVNFIRGGVRLYNHPRVPLARLDAAPNDHGAIDRNQAADDTNGSDTYMTALLKLIPAEVVSVYMAIRDSASAHKSLTIWFLLCLVVCFVLRTYASLPKSGNAGLWVVQWRGVIVSAIAFVLWAFAIGGDPPIPGTPLEQWSASALAALLALLAPLIVPGDPNTAANG
jgi:hypothetical protein